ncbi:hypothetical protein FB451DRAFT_1185818 [Mycena latifolia]|nr:hypothetical protein FB451DRAFT_1185818 [Mycena latifolia]
MYWLRANGASMTQPPRQHPTPTDSLFKPILDLLRKYVGPFALQTCFNQMKLSAHYEAKALQLPEGKNQRPMNDFANDNAYIGTRFLQRLVHEQGLVPAHLLKINHRDRRNSYYPNSSQWIKSLVVSFRTGATSQSVRFLQSPPRSINYKPGSSQAFLSQNANTNATPPPPTPTIPQGAVYTALQADLRSIMSGIQTQEQLDDARLRMAEVGQVIHSSNPITVNCLWE